MNTKTINFLIVIFSLNLTLVSCNNKADKKLTDSINTTTINKEAYKNAFLVDVRTPQEFAEGLVPNAVNIPLNEIENRLNEFLNKKEIIVFCLSGGRSSKAKNFLEQNKFTNIIDGGSWLNVKNKLTQ